MVSIIIQLLDISAKKRTRIQFKVANKESSRELNDKNKPVHTMREFHLNFPTFDDLFSVHCFHSFDCRLLVVIPNETKLLLHLNMHNVSEWLEGILEVLLANAAI